MKLSPPKQILNPHITNVIFWALSLFGSEGRRSYIFHSYMTEIHQQVWRRQRHVDWRPRRRTQSQSVVTYPFTAAFEVVMVLFHDCVQIAFICVLCCSSCFLIWYLFQSSSPKSNKMWPDVITALIKLTVDVIKLTDEFNQISHLYSCNQSTDVQKNRTDPKNQPCWVTSFTWTSSQI